MTLWHEVGHKLEKLNSASFDKASIWWLPKRSKIWKEGLPPNLIDTTLIVERDGGSEVTKWLETSFPCRVPQNQFVKDQAKFAKTIDELKPIMVDRDADRVHDGHFMNNVHVNWWSVVLPKGSAGNIFMYYRKRLKANPSDFYFKTDAAFTEAKLRFG